MSEKDEKHEGGRRYPSLTWPIILILVGVLFLLNNMGVLDVDLWNLWRLWPVLLILAGLEIIIGRRSAIGNIIVAVLTLATVGGIVLLLFVAPDVLGASKAAGVERIDEPLDGVERAELEINFPAGRLEIDQLSDSSSLITGDLELSTSRKPTWEVNRSGGRASMELRYTRSDSWPQNWQRGDEWRLSLSPNVGYTLHTSLGAGEAVLDLTGLDVRELRLEAGAGRSNIILPDEGDFIADINGGVGQMIIEIPEEMAAQITVSRGIGEVRVDNRFDKHGDSYRTSDWQSNENRVDLMIEVGIGQVIVR
jgi:hypothetical protein